MDFETGEEVTFTGVDNVTKYDAVILFIADKEDTEGDQYLLELSDSGLVHYILTNKYRIEKKG